MSTHIRAVGQPSPVVVQAFDAIVSDGQLTSDERSQLRRLNVDPAQVRAFLPGGIDADERSAALANSPALKGAALLRSTNNTLGRGRGYLGSGLRIHGLDRVPSERLGRFRRASYAVSSRDVYLRTHRQGLVIGTMFRGDRFQVLGVRGGYAWGYAKGNADKPGWIPTAALDRGSRGPLGRLPRGMPVTPRNLTGDLEYLRGSDLAAGRRSDNYLVPAGGAKVYANYSPRNGPQGLLGTVEPVTAVPIRYSYNREWAVTLYNGPGPGHHRWGFIKVSDLAG